MGFLRKRYLGAVLAIAVASLFASIANSGSSVRPSVEEYYSNLESQLGYRILLGNARHCGLWPKGTFWPLQMSKALRAMEGKLYTRLGLQNDSRVLDAGAGSGMVALYMAEHGLRVQAVDITPIHVAQAKQNVKARGLEDRISVKQGDYHDLAEFGDSTFDGVYTMETFVHADDPKKVLNNFKRLLKPGGVLVLHEADYSRDFEGLQEILRLSHCDNTLREGAFEAMLKEVGFKDIVLEDLAEEVSPLFRLFGFIGYVPYHTLKPFGLHKRFTNMWAGVEVWRNWDKGRYISIRAVKPLV